MSGLLFDLLLLILMYIHMMHIIHATYMHFSGVINIDLINLYIYSVYYCDSMEIYFLSRWMQYIGSWNLKKTECRIMHYNIAIIYSWLPLIFRIPFGLKQIMNLTNRSKQDAHIYDWCHSFSMPLLNRPLDEELD